MRRKEKRPSGEVYESATQCHPNLTSVILSAAKDLGPTSEILRCAQNDKRMGLIRLGAWADDRLPCPSPWATQASPPTVPTAPAPTGRSASPLLMDEFWPTRASVRLKLKPGGTPGLLNEYVGVIASNPHPYEIKNPGPSFLVESHYS